MLPRPLIGCIRCHTGRHQLALAGLFIPVFAFISALARVNDPRGDLCNGSGDRPVNIVKYRLWSAALQCLGGIRPSD